MKKIIIAVAAVLTLGLAVYAETNVSHGITSTGDSTLGLQATREATAARPDWSTYPTVNSRQGIIMRNYDSGLDGLPAAAAGIQFVMKSNTLSSAGYTIPSNTIIYGYTIDVLQGSGGGTQAFSLGVNAVGDVTALTTNLSAVGRWSARVNPPVKATNNVYLLLSSTATTATGLEFNVWLDAIFAP